MKRVHVDITIRLVIRVGEEMKINDIHKMFGDMDYNFISRTDGADIESTKMTEEEIIDIVREGEKQMRELIFFEKKCFSIFVPGLMLHEYIKRGGKQIIMKIKRSSWHCKISNLGRNFERINDNLCCYFWRLVGKLALIFVATILICFLGYSYFTDDFLVYNTALLLFGLSLIVFPPLAIYLIRKKLGRYPKMPYENIVAQHITAKKRKICPLIKYVQWNSNKSLNQDQKNFRGKDEVSHETNRGK